MTRLTDEECAELLRLEKLASDEYSIHTQTVTPFMTVARWNLIKFAASIGALPRLLAEREEMRRELRATAEARSKALDERDAAHAEIGRLNGESEGYRNDSTRFALRVATLEAALRAALYELSQFMPTTAGETITRIEDALEGKAGVSMEEIRPHAYCATKGCLQRSGHGGECTHEREQRERDNIESLRACLAAADELAKESITNTTLAFSKALANYRAARAKVKP